MDLELTGKVALVTGGSRGIGKAVVRALASEGATVAAVARGEETLASASVEIADATGSTVVPITADTSSDTSVAAMIREVAERLGPPDILVNCAARPNRQGGSPRWNEIDSGAMFDELNTKLMGYVRCIQGVAPYMIDRGWGRIINMSGGAARHVGSTIGSVRNASVVAMTKNFSHELGPFGINVVAVHPGAIYTERSPELIERYAATHEIPVDEARRRMYESNDLHRTIHPEDVGAVVAFLASPRAVGITGDVVSTGGGTERAIFY